jgi:hypothetical protein
MTNSELIQDLDFDEMLYKLSKEEPLTQMEVKGLEDFITSSVKGPKEKRSLEDLYAALKVVSSSNLQHLSYLAAMCLDVPDPILVCLALETLAIQWGFGTEYEERLIQFALGVPCDYEGDIKECALRCIGVLLSDQQDQGRKRKNNSYTQTEERLLCLLIQIIEDKKEDEFVKSAALEALKNINLEGNKTGTNESNEVWYDTNVIQNIKSQLSVSSLLDSEESELPGTGMR